MAGRANRLIRVCAMAWVVVLVGLSLADDKLNSLMSDGKFAKAAEYIDQSIPVPQRTVEIWLLYAEAEDKYNP
ncbi:MAG TPA: hypothetical protein VF335_09730, partial [Chitinivibrionales bacterium]